jgi:hypothetical protein
MEGGSAYDKVTALVTIVWVSSANGRLDGLCGDAKRITGIELVPGLPSPVRISQLQGENQHTVTKI